MAPIMITAQQNEHVNCVDSRIHKKDGVQVREIGVLRP